MAQSPVEFIRDGIKAREHHWQTEYQQGYQRALSDIMLYIDEAMQIEMNKCISDYNTGYEDAQCNHINDAHNYANEIRYINQQ